MIYLRYDILSADDIRFAHEGTDIISYLRSRYIMQRKLYIISHKRYIIFKKETSLEKEEKIPKVSFIKNGQKHLQDPYGASADIFHHSHRHDVQAFAEICL